MVPRSLLAALVALGIVLTATVVPGVFIIDEDNYLVTLVGLRQGRLSVPGTEGLTPSRELRYFDPTGRTQPVTATPVVSTAPPLYAPLALSFSWAGWRGLVALNTLAFLVAAALVFAYTRRYAAAPHTPWLAVAAFALGGYSLEYAQGLWPHSLAALLVLAAVVLAARVRDGAPLAAAFAAGIGAGLAAGLRYQNAFLAAGIGLGVLLWAPRRLRSSAAFAAGLALPLGASSLVNHLRLGSWNPISKGRGYLPSGAAAGGGDFLRDALTMGWARIVDFSVRPPLSSPEHAYLHASPATGAYLIGPAMKKAWLQSSPWIALALLACLLAWLLHRQGPREPVRRELRSISLVVGPTLALFAAAGVGRSDGLCFNQRYFLELVPLAAVAFAWALDGVRIERPWLLAGGLIGAGGALAALGAGGSDSPLRQVLLLRLPLALAVALVGCWALARRPGAPRAISLAAGACLAWALGVHLGDDLPAARSLRRQNAFLNAVYARALPDRAALIAYGGLKDAAGPLQLDRDLVILDPHNDQGETLPALLADFRRDRRRVFLVASGFPPALLQSLLRAYEARPVVERPVALLEIIPKPTPDLD